MEYLNDTTFAVACIPGRVRYPAHSATLIAKGTFALVQDKPVVPADEALPLCGDVHWEDDESKSLRYESDFALFKPKADVLVVGTCHPPFAKPATVLSAGFQISSLRKSVAVLGDRPSLASMPSPFRQMPIRYENAFGGEGFPENPVGRGMSNTPPPNIEDRNRLMTSASDRPPPAGLGPIHRTWKQRKSKAGTYRERWLRERWPWFPEDFDWGYFNAAPADQQAPFLKGNEELVLENLHPAAARYRTLLPGLRVRGFLWEGSEFREVPMVLDTVWVAPDEDRMVLVWRGTADVKLKELRSVQRVRFVCEPLSSPPRPADQYRPLPVAPSEAPPEPEPKEPPEPDEEPEAVEDAIERVLASAAEELKKAGVVPVAPQRAGAPKDLRASLGELRRIFKKLGKDPKELDEIESLLEEKVHEVYEEEPERPDRDEVLRRIRDTGVRGEDLSGIDLSGEELAGVRMLECLLDGANLARANLSGADLSGSILSEARLSETNFARANLSGVDATRATAKKANFEGAVLEGAIFEEADLDGAIFRAARASGAVFARARLTRADLSGALLEGANVAEAGLEWALLVGAKMAQASLEGANAKRSDLRESDLSKLRATGGADFSGADLRRVRAAGSMWEGANLASADLSLAELDGADFTEANLTGAKLAGATLKGARFARANLKQAHMIGANLFRADMTEAELVATDLRGSNLFEAEFLEARIEGTRFELALLKRTKLSGRAQV